jgi:hypothetical protein
VHVRFVGNIEFLKEFKFGKKNLEFWLLPIYETILYKPENGLMEINRISSDVLSGNNSHFNAGIDESISTK